jgi:capsid protein
VIAEDRETYRDLQSFFIRMAMNKVYAYWLHMHLGYNVATTIPVSRKLAILATSKFTGRSWLQIDPTKDTKAENEQLAARTTSLSRICADRGISRDDLLDEIEDDEQALKDRGLTQSFGGGNTDPAKSSASSKDTDDDDDE